MKVLGQSITELPKTPAQVELAVIAGSTAALSGFLFVIGKEERGLERAAAWTAAGVFVAAGIGAAVKLCLASKEPAPGTTTKG
jgi:hypothetical protein